MSVERIAITDRVFAIAPRFRRVVLLGDIERSADTTAVRDAFNLAQKHAREGIAATGDGLESWAQLAEWRRAFAEAGIASKYKPAVESLIGRVAGGPLKPIAPLVDAGTAISLVHLVAVGVHVVDGLDGDLELRSSPGDEPMETLNGQIEHTKQGELVWACGPTILTRRWAWRQGRKGSVAPDSKKLAVNVDLIDGVDAGAVEGMRNLLAACGTSVRRVVTLDAINREVDLETARGWSAPHPDLIDARDGLSGAPDRHVIKRL